MGGEVVVLYMEGAGGADGGPLFLGCNGRKGGRKGGLTSVVLLIDRYMNNAICLTAQCYPRIAFANVLGHPFLEYYSRIFTLHTALLPSVGQRVES